MSKKRKTRKEKIIAELRRKVHQSTTHNTTLDKTPSTPENRLSFQLDTIRQTKKTAPLISSTTAIRDYSHVLKEAQKTLMITGVILVVNITLFVAIQNKFISLSVFGL